MKTLHFLLVIALFFTVSIAGAQDDSKSDLKTDYEKVTESVSEQPGMNSLMTQLVNGIETSAFKDGVTGQTEVLKLLSGTDVSEIQQYGLVLGSLAGALNSSAFLSDWAENEKPLMAQLQNAVSISDVAGGVLEMSGMIDRSVLTSDFVDNLSTWQSAMESLSMAK